MTHKNIRRSKSKRKKEWKANRPLNGEQSFVLSGNVLEQRYGSDGQRRLLIFFISISVKLVYVMKPGLCVSSLLCHIAQTLIGYKSQNLETVRVSFWSLAIVLVFSSIVLFLKPYLLIRVLIRFWVSWLRRLQIPWFLEVYAFLKVML